MLGSLVGRSIGEKKAPKGLAIIDLRADVFRRLVDQHLDGAYRLAAVILNDRDEAEDAVHEATVSAWRGFAGLRAPARFEAWYRRILINECRDRLRTRARHRAVHLGRDLAETEHPQVADPSEAAAARDAVARALDTLTPDELVLVTLRFYADLTVPAVAAVLGIPEGTVKSRLHTGLARLRAALEVPD